MYKERLTSSIQRKLQLKQSWFGKLNVKTEAVRLNTCTGEILIS